VRDVMATAKPEVVIYAVRERAAGGDTPLPAAECEAALAALAGAAHAAGAWVLYVSSDEVFLGRGGSHRPEDPACPAGPAGELKVRLEAALARATGGDCGVLRLPPLYGALSKIGESSVTVLAKLVFPRVRAGAKVDDWLRRFPTHAADAAAAALRLAEARAKGGAGVRGAWHYAADTPLTDLQIVIVIADILRADIAPGGAPALEAAVGDESRPQESAPPTPPYPSPRGALARPGACCEATFLARARRRWDSTVRPSAPSAPSTAPPRPRPSPRAARAG
jgi:dTDP-4-dehydrorhamnose reductase